MTIGDIIILAAYAIGVLLTIHFQGKKISALKTQVESQSGVIENMQRFMSIFRLEEIEKYVEISRKTSEAEKREAIRIVEAEKQEFQKQAEAEKQKTISQVEAEIKAKASESISVLRKEQEALLDLAIKLINRSPMIHETKEYIEQMKDDVISKKHLLSIYEKNRAVWAGYPNNVIKAIIAQSESLRAPWAGALAAIMQMREGFGISEYEEKKKEKT